MAGNYLVQTQTPSVQVLGPTESVPVMEVGFTTLPHNVYAVVSVPLDAWNADGAAAFIAPLADGIESLWGIQGVVGAVFEQDIDPSGLLVGNIVVTVEAAPPTPAQFGPMTAEVRVPVWAFGESALVGGLIRGPIDAAYATLVATASL